MKDETEKIKLTNTAEVQLWKIPRSRWAEIKRLFLANDYLSLITIWNNCGVSPERICPGCPWGITRVHPHIEILVKKYDAEDEATEETARRGIEAAVIVEEVIIESKKKKKGGKNESGQNGQNASGGESQGPDDMGAENIV
jgi:hypothetical protein